MSTLAKAISNMSSSFYIKELFDPIQTHAVCGVHKDQVAEVKETLKAYGANRFRVVSTHIKDLKIVCFKQKK